MFHCFQDTRDPWNSWNRRGTASPENDKENNALLDGNIFEDSERDFRLVLRPTQTQRYSEALEPLKRRVSQGGFLFSCSGDLGGEDSEHQRGIKRRGSEARDEDAQPEKLRRPPEEEFFESSENPEAGGAARSQSLVATEDLSVDAFRAETEGGESEIPASAAEGEFF